MSILALTAVFVASAVVLGLAVHAMVVVIRNDGYYPRRTSASPVGMPPRSHPVDEFDPRSRFAA
jgi:hypothetical protein